MNIIILLGPPGAGKGTISETLVNYGVKHVSTGDMLRQEIRTGTELGKRSHEKISKGLFADDHDVMKMVYDYLLNEPNQYIIFDGFPRTEVQAIELEKLTKKTNLNIFNVLQLICPKEVLVARLSGRRTCVCCGAVYHDLFSPPKISGRCDLDDGTLAKRLDDEPAIIKRRLKIYDELTQPLSDFYNQRNMLTKLDSNCTPKEVAEKAKLVFKKIIK